MAAAAAVILLAPSLSRSLWIARLALRETSLAVAAAGACALWLLRGSALRAARCAAALSAAIGFVAFAGPLAAWGTAWPEFSLVQYLAWGRPLPEARVERDVLLEPGRSELAADIWRGKASGPRPLVVVVHGGSWRGGDKGEADHTSRHLAAAGYGVADVRYRFAPEHRFPDPVGDVKCLLGRLRESASRFGIDPLRIALLGRSAGGQIALIAAYSQGDARVPPSCPVEDRAVSAVASLYGPTDLVWGFRNPMVPDVIRGNEALRVYLGGSPEESPEAYRLGSPCSWTDRPLPPTLLVHGRGDAIVRSVHAERLAECLARGGHRVRALYVPFAEHGFDVRPGGVGEQLARRTLLSFLDETLR